MLQVHRVLAALRRFRSDIDRHVEATTRPPPEPIDPGDAWRGKLLYEDWREAQLIPWLTLPWRWVPEADRRHYIALAKKCRRY